jgi:hypothetical protein
VKYVCNAITTELRNDVSYHDRDPEGRSR